MESNTSLTPDIISKYNISATICGKIYNTLKNNIISNKERNIKSLCELGNSLILSELNNIHKKIKNKNIAFPVCISLNDIISNYTGNKDDENIKDTDIIKIKLAVSLDGYISVLTQTFIIKENKPIQKIINFLDDMETRLLQFIKHEETVDETRIFIESRCTEQNIFPIPNCVSYQQEQSFISRLDSKYMSLNYTPFYDTNDILITNQNINFEFQEDDIFTINLTVIPISDDNIKVVYKTVCNSGIYRMNETNYNLKLKSSRDFYSKIKSNHSNYAFNIENYTSNPKNKIGISECKQKNILDEYMIIAPQDNIPVISKEFTIIICKNNSKKLLYKLT